MFDTLATYYHENVVSAFIEYRDKSLDKVAGKSRDLRAALAAATALFHFREYLPQPEAPSRTAVEGACPDYMILGDIVNAAKHKKVTKTTPHGTPLVIDASQLSELILITEFEDGIGTYQHVQKTVIVRFADGSERYLLDIFTNVLNYWEQHLKTIGTLTTARTFTCDTLGRYRTRNECSGNKLDFEMLREARSKQVIRLLRFNQNTGEAEAIDLTGVNARLKIFQPKYDLDVCLTHKASGNEYQTTIFLTEDESLTLANLSSEAERQAFVASLPSAVAALQQLAVEATRKNMTPD